MLATAGTIHGTTAEHGDGQELDGAEAECPRREVARPRHVQEVVVDDGVPGESRVSYSASAHQPKASARPSATPGHGSQRSSGRDAPAERQREPDRQRRPSAASGSLARGGEAEDGQSRDHRASGGASTMPVSVSANPPASIASSKVSGRT